MRFGGQSLLTRISAIPAVLIARAVDQITRRCALGIFLTRWLFTPIGPWANLAAGATGFNHLRSALWTVAGKAVWVTLYVPLGYSLTDSI